MGVKTLLYITLAAFLLVILCTPVIETLMMGRDKILLSSTVFNSFRAANETSYSYRSMRDINAVVHKQAFRESFADTFCTSYDMYCADTSSDTLRFQSYDGTYNDYIVRITFSDPEQLPYDDEGSALVTRVKVTAESNYKFRTRLMQFMNETAIDPFVLHLEREYTMRVTN